MILFTCLIKLTNVGTSMRVPWSIMAPSKILNVAVINNTSDFHRSLFRKLFSGFIFWIHWQQRILVFSCKCFFGIRWTLMYSFFICHILSYPFFWILNVNDRSFMAFLGVLSGFRNDHCNTLRPESKWTTTVFSSILGTLKRSSQRCMAALYARNGQYLGGFCHDSACSFLFCSNGCLSL